MNKIEEEEDGEDELIIPHAVFQQFCDEKGVEGPCDRCGAVEWMTNSLDPKGQRLEPLTLPDRGVRRYVPVFLNYCNNCGNAKLFVAEPLLEWRRSRG